MLPIHANDDREHLRVRSINTLRNLAGATTLLEFGSAKKETCDDLSDIDLQVITVDVEGSVADRARVIAEIAPVMLVWTFLRTPTAWASTVLFEGVSPFIHLDVGFAVDSSEEKSSMLEGSTLHWTQAPPGNVLEPSPTLYESKMGSVEHVMLGETLGLIRYAKARRRDHDLLCLKFFSALANRVLEAEYLAVVDADRGFKKPHTGHEHNLLR